VKRHHRPGDRWANVYEPPTAAAALARRTAEDRSPTWSLA